jgi:hypothetical protein
MVLCFRRRAGLVMSSHAAWRSSVHRTYVSLYSERIGDGDGGDGHEDNRQKTYATEATSST